jgi:hypothetical protein
MHCFINKKSIIIHLALISHYFLSRAQALKEEHEDFLWIRINCSDRLRARFKVSEGVSVSFPGRSRQLADLRFQSLRSREKLESLCASQQKRSERTSVRLRFLGSWVELLSTFRVYDYNACYHLFQLNLFYKGTFTLWTCKGFLLTFLWNCMEHFILGGYVGFVLYKL